jgi:DNA repair protein RadC
MVHRLMTNMSAKSPMSSDARETELPGCGDLERLGEVMNVILQIYKKRQRLRQCLIKAGPENLPDYELLQILLFTIAPRTEVDTVVEELLARFGGLAEVLSAEIDALAAAGLRAYEIAAVKFVREVALRLMTAEFRERPLIGSFDKLIDYCKTQLAYSKVEEFHILFLDRKNVLIKDERQQRGTIDHTPVYTREVIKRALELGASSLILVHNHPSGDLTPSTADIAVTKDIIKTAATLNIAVHDHLIIGRGGHTSLRDLGFIPSKSKKTEVLLSAPVLTHSSSLHGDNPKD